MKPGQRFVSAQGRIGRAIIARAGVPVVPSGDEYADGFGQGRELAREGTHPVILWLFLVRSGYTNLRVPPVL